MITYRDTLDVPRELAWLLAGELLKRIRREADRHGIDVSEEQGGRHTKLRVGGQLIPLPRHTEINEVTAQLILKQCDDQFGEGWWRR